MPLPNPGMSFSPFAILTAEEMNDMAENIEALADGSGLDDGSVTGPKLAIAKTTDANGWSVRNFGNFNRYTKVFTGSASVGTSSTAVLLNDTPLPTGLTSFADRMWFSGFTANEGDAPWISYRIGYSGSSKTSFDISAHNAYAGGSITPSYTITVVIEDDI